MKAVLFDTETTGLIDNRTVGLERQPHVIEFYGCVADLKKGKVLKELEFLIQPPKLSLITDIITKITTITPETVKDAPVMGVVADKIFKFLEGAPVVIAHNLSFDLEMMDIEAQRLDRKIKWPKQRLCTVEQTVHLKGFRLNLSNLHQHLFGEKFDGAHRAKVDVMALLRCCTELVKREVL